MGLTVLDAGIVIALLDSTDGHHRATRAALHRARDRSDELVIPASAYAETLVAPYRSDPAAAATVDAFLDALPATVAPISRAIASHAARLRAEHRSLRLPDAVAIATALALGAERLLTTDWRWPAVGIGVEVVHTSDFDSIKHITVPD